MTCCYGHTDRLCAFIDAKCLPFPLFTTAVRYLGELCMLLSLRAEAYRAPQRLSNSRLEALPRPSEKDARIR
jgi:hypothetical protein